MASIINFNAENDVVRNVSEKITAVIGAELKDGETLTDDDILTQVTYPQTGGAVGKTLENLFGLIMADEALYKKISDNNVKLSTVLEGAANGIAAHAADKDRILNGSTGIFMQRYGDLYDGYFTNFVDATLTRQTQNAADSDDKRPVEPTRPQEYQHRPETPSAPSGGVEFGTGMGTLESKEEYARQGTASTSLDEVMAQKLFATEIANSLAFDVLTQNYADELNEYIITVDNENNFNLEKDGITKTPLTVLSSIRQIEEQRLVKYLLAEAGYSAGRNNRS